MVQHAGGLDDIKPVVELRKFQNVGLGILNVPNPKLLGLLFGIGQARTAEIDRQNLRVRYGGRRVDRMAPRPSAGNENTRPTR